MHVATRNINLNGVSLRCKICKPLLTRMTGNLQLGTVRELCLSPPKWCLVHSRRLLWFVIWPSYLDLYSVRFSSRLQRVIYPHLRRYRVQEKDSLQCSARNLPRQRVHAIQPRQAASSNSSLRLDGKTKAWRRMQISS